jgi:hypothetical protein
MAKRLPKGPRSACRWAGSARLHLRPFQVLDDSTLHDSVRAFPFALGSVGNQQAPSDCVTHVIARNVQDIGGFLDVEQRGLGEAFPVG